MLKIDPKNRPTVEDLIKIPKIKLRIHERKRRDEYARLKYKESRLEKKRIRAKIKITWYSIKSWRIKIKRNQS